MNTQQSILKIKNNLPKYLLVAAIMYMPIFGHLTSLPFQIWDEARLANNAYEMFNNNNFIVTSYGNQPDMWNTKPPLMIWFQVFFMHLFGVNELAVRLPSALAALFTCIGLLAFFEKTFKSFWFATITVAVLITTGGYIALHVSRTGDYDALLVFFTTIGGLSFFHFTETFNNRFLYYFFIATTLSVLTKSVTGLLFLPAMFLYVIYRKQFVIFLKNKHLYIGIGIFIFFVGGYYIIREIMNNGYLQAVQNNELGGRYLETNEGHGHEFWYYFHNIVDYQMKFWYLFIPAGLFIGIFSKNEKIKRLTIFSALMVVVFFLVISAAKTSLHWYTAPLFPFLAILVAICLHFIFLFIQQNNFINNQLTKNILPYLFLLFLIFTPYQTILNETISPEKDNFYEMSTYLREALRGKHDVNNCKIIYKYNNQHLTIYTALLNKKNCNLSFADWTQLQNGDKIVVSQKEMQDSIDSKYVYEVEQYYGNIRKMKILQNKNFQLDSTLIN